MNAPQNFHAVNPRHVDVAKQNIDITLFQFAQRGLAIGRDLHAITEPLQLFLQSETKISFVFGNQNAC